MPTGPTGSAEVPVLAGGHGNPLRPPRQPVRWGVVSTGRIASIVARDLALHPDAVLQAVSSRSRGNAEDFAAGHGFRRAYGDDAGTPGYVRLFQDQDVDVVYVATPHASHYAMAKAALEAGKHVLCEKPMTMTSGEAESLVTLAREKGLFLMEAVWTRFLPSFQRATQIVASGELGDIRWIQADLGFPAPYHPDARLWRREDGGGSLLDVGVYLLTWARGVLGPPQSLTATAHLNSDGVDAETALALFYDSGARVQLLTSLSTVCTQSAAVSGTKGLLQCNAPLYNPTELTITLATGKVRVEKFSPVGSGYTYQLHEVIRCIQQGLTESPTMPLSETLATMALLDEARRQAGIHYPADGAG